MFKKMIATIMAVLLLCALITGCGSEVVPEEPPVEEVHQTSEELNLYSFGNEVYDHDGNAVEGYFIDDEGNIADGTGKIFVCADDVAPFLYITEAEITDEAMLEQKIAAEHMEDDQIATTATTFALKFRATPLGAFQKTIAIESNDPGALYFPYEENKELFSEDIEEPEDGALPSASFALDENGEVEIQIVGCFDGTFHLVIRNIFGAVIGECDVTLIPEYTAETETDGEGGSVKPSETASEHEHEFVDSVVKPTAAAGGYTSHRCKICGYTFRDTYTDKLPCQHQYTESVVAATYAAGGYTLHRCTICGDSYRDNETAPLACEHAHMTSSVVAPTCTNQGYTLHECSDCHKYSYQDGQTPALGHSWNGGTVTTAPTCGAAGQKTYTCTRCGATNTESVPATGSHTYTDQVVAPTCTEAGYTLHTCSVCGASYTDAQTPALGHDYQAHTEKVQTGQAEGVFCRDCGINMVGWPQASIGSHIEQHVLADPEHAKGSYYTTLAPVYEEVTTYVCSRCGATK